ncbi:MAG: two-component sensor histidine kinase [Gammaproteobacteria bacterium RIFOXYA12_FULL_61_12]|nr:MAG: two-component sensor histidine kinase [Gammaproteobacteria bacterium RIFOXYD12_FULL_61_37]OGT94629.1 MAG: two-component sensor histidine kinase [Gammaproteobacteria bacterium RIFOXYA12_FULL_61_12]
MASDPLRPSRSGWPILGLLLVLLLVLHFLSRAVQDVEGSSRFFVPLLLFAIGGLILLALLILISGIRLWLEYRQKKVGSRLTLRMVIVFLLLSLPPVTLVYYYSLETMLRGIEHWFDVDIDGAVEDALRLSQVSLDLHKREKLRLTNYLMMGVQDSSETALALSIDELRERFEVRELVLTDLNNRVIASSSADPANLVPSPPQNDAVRQVKEGEPFVDLVLSGEGGMLRVRVVVADPKGRPFILQALYETPEQISAMTGKVQESFRRYRELAYLRDSLKFSFGLTLLLVLLYASLAAIWAAFFSARRLVAPVTQIAEGTRAVAEGHYDKQLPLPRGRDELTFLVSSFNSMTRSIALARDMTERSQQEVETQRAYLQTVLGRLSSGVMAFGSNLCLQTANPSARQILGVDLDSMQGKPLYQLGIEHPGLQDFVDAIEEPLAESHGEWRNEVTLFTGEGRKVLLCSVSPLAMPWDEAAGHVLVFDDVTALLQAQRNAAWGGVAQRLAHEIKNPLTPIQLSAERLRHKLLDKLADEDRQMLDRATRTIVQQVEAMKEMVNAFSDFARSPKMQAEPIVFDPFINDALDLYRVAGQGTTIKINLAAGPAKIEADPARLRQVVVNLVKNALEALESVPEGFILVSTRLGEGEESNFVELEVRDNGPGFSSPVLEHLFEPYVTTKTKGSGLGLAIVKKIVEEHGGIVRAENLNGCGAHILIYLPLLGVYGETGEGEQSVEMASR